MAYIKQNFIDGDILHASELNHIENGIVDIENDLNDLDNELTTNYALKNLSNVPNGSVTQEYSLNIPIANWLQDSSGDFVYQNINVSGIQANDKAIIDIDLSNVLTWSEKVDKVSDWANIVQVLIYDGMITLNAYATPLSDLKAKMMVIRK